MLLSVVVVVVGLHDYVSIILYLTITVRHYTLGTTLNIYFSYFPCGKKVVCTDALTKVCALCLLCLLCSVDSSRWFTWVVKHLLTCIFF